MKLTKRDLRIFLLGMLAMFAIECIYDWKDTVASFKKGYNEAGMVKSKQ